MSATEHARWIPADAFVPDPTDPHAAVPLLAPARGPLLRRPRVGALLAMAALALIAGVVAGRTAHRHAAADDVHAAAQQPMLVSTAGRQGTPHARPRHRAAGHDRARHGASPHRSARHDHPARQDRARDGAPRHRSARHHRTARHRPAAGSGRRPSPPRVAAAPGTPAPSPAPPATPTRAMKPAPRATAPPAIPAPRTPPAPKPPPSTDAQGRTPPAP
jgi:hypothetical protein